ncbi:MAG: Ig-like domain-containing protein, partial [Candidatus Saccharimonadaceae bacterium]|nr:Ig-like domain-containing protein [Candidatus Saccharimonadaceae bacterium]
MKLSQKLHSVLENKSYLKKSRLFLSLTAIGVLGGFFVTNAILNPAVSVNNVAAGEVVKDAKIIKWTTDCSENATVGINLAIGETFYKSIAKNVPCNQDGYSWNTEELEEGVQKYSNGQNYKIMVYNASMEYGYSGTFTVDNENPTIDSNTIDTPSSVWAGTVGQTISWNAAGIHDNFNLVANPISLSYSLNAGTPGEAWTEIATGQSNVESFLWTPSTINSSNVTLKIRAIDQAGNFSEQTSGVFAIDSTNPTVVANGITVSNSIIKDEVGTNGNLIQVVTVSYSEPMNAAISPNIVFSKGTWTTGAGSWTNNNTVWVQDFTLTDKEEAETGVTITASGAKDSAGNTQASSTSAGLFLIDTQNPTVVSATANPNPAKAVNTEITIVFSEGMDTTTVATLPFVQVTGIGTNLINVVKTSFSGTTWTGSFNFNETVDTTATIVISNGADVNGNVAIANNTKTFEVDSVVPTVTGISFGTATIHDSDLIQEVTVGFNEEMGATAPAVVLSAAGFSASAGSWSGDKKTWTQDFTTTDQNINAVGVTATVSSATDLARNAITSTTSSSLSVPTSFAIDTTNPTVVVSDGVLGSDYVVKSGETVIFTATFSEVVTSPAISIVTTGTDDINAAVMTLAGDGKSATYSWAVPVGNDGAATVSITANDSAGNVNAPATGEVAYTIDNQPPTAGITYSITHAVKSGDLLTITATFSEDVAGTPTISFCGATTMASTPMSGNSKVWTYNYSVPGSVSGDVNIAISATDVAGNAATISSGGSFIIDNTIPTVSLTSPIAVLYRSAVPLKITGTDATTTPVCTYAVDGTPKGSVDCTKEGSDANKTLTPLDLSDGRHTIVVTVTDMAGNAITATSAEFIFTSDAILTVGADDKDFTSIQAAIDAASNGDKIDVATGTYEEHVIVSGKTGLRLVGATGAIIKPIPNPSLNEFLRNAITIAADSSNMEVSGFTINVNGEFYGISSKGAAGVKILSNDISGYNRNGVYVTGGEVEITGNAITGSLSTTFSVDSIYTSGATLTIKNNILTGNKFDSQTSTATGIALHAGDNATITGNTITGNSFGVQIKGAKNAEGVNPIVSMSKNTISGNDVLNLFFEYRGVESSYNVSYNWWGSKVKSAIASKIAKRASDSVVNLSGSINFAPWYLDNTMTVDSDSDKIGPVIVLSILPANKAVVKKGDAITISANITDAGAGVDDSIAPAITITNGKVAGAEPDTTTLTGTMTWDSVAAKWTYSWTAPDLAGVTAASVSVKAYDVIGNEGSSTLSFTNDNELPVLIPVVAVATPTKDNTPEYTFGSSEAGSVTYTNCTGSLSSAVANSNNVVTFNRLADGTHDNCTISVTDLAGNTGSVTVNSFVVDTVAPVTTNSTVASVYNGNTAVTLTPSDVNAAIVTSGVDKTFYCVDQNNSCTSWVEGTSAPVSVEGKNYVRFYSTDKVGNIEEIKHVEVNIDVTAPQITITAPVANAKVNGDAAIAFTDSETTTPQCSIDNNSWVACPVSGKKLSDLTGFSGLADGTFILYVKDTDLAANTGSASVGLTKDAFAPTITGVSSVVADGTYKEGKIIDINATFSEAVSGSLKVRLNTSTQTVERFCTITVSNATTGTCNYTVGAGDNTADLDVTFSSADLADVAGNKMAVFSSSLAVTRNIIIDTTAPELHEKNPVATPGKITTPTYVFT